MGHLRGNLWGHLQLVNRAPSAANLSKFGVRISPPNEPRSL